MGTSFDISEPVCSTIFTDTDIVVNSKPWISLYIDKVNSDKIRETKKKFRYVLANNMKDKTKSLNVDEYYKLKIQQDDRPCWKINSQVW